MFDVTTGAVEYALRGLGMRSDVRANNIANAETPGYKRVDVQFEAALAEAVQSDRARLRRDAAPGAGIMAVADAVGSTTPSVRSVDTTTMRVDGSNVDPDDEMAQLSANQLAHQTVISLLDKRFTQFRTAITGR
jgi:flagellar basal-body rod protein FlgB